MAPLIVSHATANFLTDATPAVLLFNVGCYSTALELTPSTEDVDVGVFCAPSLTDQGRTTFSAVLSMLWEPAVYTDFAAHVGERLWFTFRPDTTLAPPTYISFYTRYAAVPWGRFEVGQRVEVELPLAVLSTPVYGT